MSSAPAKDWCITLHCKDGVSGWNAQQVLEELNESWSVRNGICMREKNGDNTHFQIFVQLKNKKRLGWLKKQLRADWQHIHLEKRKGTAAQAWDYCAGTGKHKDKPGQLGPAFVLGSYPTPERARTDLSTAVEAISAAPTMETIRSMIAERPNLLRVLPHMRTFAEMSRPARSQRTWIIWLHGPAGSGKDFFAQTYSKVVMPYSDVYVKSNSKWWDGYDGEEVILWDNFDPACVSYDFICKLGDTKKIKVEVKGLSVNVVAKLVFITTVWNPKDYFAMAKKNKGATPDELERRAVFIPWNREKRDKLLATHMQIYDEIDQKSADYGYSEPNPLPSEHRFERMHDKYLEVIRADEGAYCEEEMLERHPPLRLVREWQVPDYSGVIPREDAGLESDAETVVTDYGLGSTGKGEMYPQ